MIFCSTPPIKAGINILPVLPVTPTAAPSFAASPKPRFCRNFTTSGISAPFWFFCIAPVIRASSPAATVLAVVPVFFVELSPSCRFWRASAGLGKSARLRSFASRAPALSIAIFTAFGVAACVSLSSVTLLLSCVKPLAVVVASGWLRDCSWVRMSPSA